MKTQEVLDKYRKIIAGILNCNPTDILFYISDRENTNITDQIGELKYEKSSDWSLGMYTVKQKFTDKEVVISTFKLYELPHCCAFMVSCNVMVQGPYRNKRIGTILNSLRQDIGRLLGYSSILCTDIETNVNQRKLLATNGWRDIYAVLNKRTKNKVYLSVIDI